MRKFQLITQVLKRTTFLKLNYASFSYKSRTATVLIKKKLSEISGTRTKLEGLDVTRIDEETV